MQKKTSAFSAEALINLIRGFGFQDWLAILKAGFHLG